ncbi:uncharacterized protein C8R40DRAFT_1070827 [Lentinula edodes]|uniref:uncharacterized protein n=1 Tax=Lentinula edodes TaxID=5353 RepID=UPI001E8D0D07|nr:uncharacterized protein C8R40DRAFT_1070827 [Lentinula edodes]KAH7873614.1 hypothetical protein C8R40DRAFT_1070827 [Lentinula edodes]
MCFGFLIPDEHMQSVGKMYHDKLYPDDEIEDYYAHATYGDVASTTFMERAKQLPWATPRMETVYSTRDGDIGRVVSLFDNYSHHLGQLGSPRRPGPKQLTRGIIEQYQKAIEVDILPRWYYLTDQSVVCVPFRNVMYSTPHFGVLTLIFDFYIGVTGLVTLSSWINLSEGRILALVVARGSAAGFGQSHVCAARRTFKSFCGDGA